MRPSIGVAITGTGLWCALGRKPDEVAAAMVRGDNGHRTGPEGTAAALSDAVFSGELDPCAEALSQVVSEALAGRGADALVIGCCNGGLHSRALARVQTERALELLERGLVSSIGPAVAQRCGLRVPVFTVSTACTSSALALGFAMDLVVSGLAQRVVVGGVDLLNPRVSAGFKRLGALAEGACAPFSSPSGMSLGEGAAALVLEGAEHGFAAIWLAGRGAAADGWHQTAPDPRGQGMARSIAAALADAGLPPDEVDWFDAQGTGTDANDAAEAQALVRVFTGPIPVTAPKSRLGHTLGAAGALETALAVEALVSNAVPAIAGFTEPRPGAPEGVLREPLKPPAPLSCGVVNTAAFGGSNASLVVRTRPTAPAFDPSPVGVLSIARVGPDQVKGLLPRRARIRDPRARLLCAAVRVALEEAGLPRGNPARAQAGLAVCVGAHPPGAARQFVDRLNTHTPEGAARAFSGSVPNAATGWACKLHGLLGPTSTWVGPGLVALLEAMLRLQRRPGPEHMAAAAVDVATPGAVEHAMLAGLEPPTEGAVALVLSRGPAASRIRATAIQADSWDVTQSRPCSESLLALEQAMASGATQLRRAGMEIQLLL